jgi:pilus assembly protein CpaD
MNRDPNTTPKRRRSRSNVIRVALLAGTAALVSGCMTSGSRDITASAPVDYRQRHPIVIKEKVHTTHLFIGNSHGSLNAEQRAEVYGFAQAWRRDATGGIIIDVPVGTPNAAAAGGAASQAQALLVRAGVPPNGISMRGYRPGNPRELATVRLNYPRMAAEAGPCGQWPADLGAGTGNDIQNRPYWNLGCAQQRNLAAMVANPADLVQPRSETPPNAGRRSIVLDAYRRGEQTSSKAPDNSSAKISDVGK